MDIEIYFKSGSVQTLKHVHNFHFYENPMESRIIIVDEQVFVHSCSPSSIDSIIFSEESLDE